MMANRHRGEISARLDGRDWTLCLTLGVLAELEAAFDADDLATLIAAMGSGRLTSRQMAAILAAGLRGGGHDVTAEEVAEMRCEGGIGGLARIVADLFAASFAEGSPIVRASPKGQPPPNPILPQPTAASDA